MRKTLRIQFSLPKRIDDMIDEIVQYERYMTRSEMIRDLVEGRYNYLLGVKRVGDASADRLIDNKKEERL